MILVLLGTFPTAFPRPLIEIEKLCKEGWLKEEIIVQNGHTQFESSYMTMRTFIPPDELTALCIDARIVISHAGTGSLTKAIKLGKKIIAVARLAKYQEMVDDHQVEILTVFSDLNYVLPWTDGVSLSTLLQSIEDFKPSPYVSNKQDIIKYLDDYITSL